MNLTKPLALINLMAVSLLILCSSAGAQEAPAGADNKKPPAGEGHQKKPDKCERAALTARNWDMVGRDYVYFDYVLCPPGLQPPSPLVRVWLTTRGDGFAIEKWAEGREGADAVSLYHGKKRAFTLYRDLDAVPLALLTAKGRSAVPSETAKRPFLLEGVKLIPLDNLTKESAERVGKVFGSADALVRQAQRKGILLHEMPNIEVIVEALEQPIEAQT
jgi:hypothetical protein